MNELDEILNLNEIVQDIDLEIFKESEPDIYYTYRMSGLTDSDICKIINCSSIVGLFKSEKDI